MQIQDVILDTDIGDNIDDALALALLLNSPEVRLRGVTTVFRNAPRRAALARHLLDAWGHSSTRVVAGLSKPLLEPYDFQMGTQFQILPDDVWHDSAHAVDFLIEAARIDEEPDPENALTLLCIGPLTNIAVALAREPELVPRVRIVLMGGCWSRLEPETNIHSDPEAAAIVFRSGAEIDMVGLDVTRRCQLSPEQTQAVAAASTRSAPLGLFSDCLTWEDKHIEVELAGANRGCTVVCNGEPNVRVAVDVDAERAVELCLARLLK
jgi:inosine-uridine nucleoside N-ribohydrolase